MLIVPVDCLPLPDYSGLDFDLPFDLHHDKPIILFFDFGGISAMQYSEDKFYNFRRERFHYSTSSNIHLQFKCGFGGSSAIG